MVSEKKIFVEVNDDDDDDDDNDDGRDGWEKLTWFFVLVEPKIVK